MSFDRFGNLVLDLVPVTAAGSGAAVQRQDDRQLL